MPPPPPPPAVSDSNPVTNQSEGNSLVRAAESLASAVAETALSVVSAAQNTISSTPLPSLGTYFYHLWFQHFVRIPTRRGRGVFSQIRDICQIDQGSYTENPDRVATTQGKQGIWFLRFSKQGKHREFCCNTGKIFETQGKYF